MYHGKMAPSPCTSMLSDLAFDSVLKQTTEAQIRPTALGSFLAFHALCIMYMYHQGFIEDNSTLHFNLCITRFVITRFWI